MAGMFPWILGRLRVMGPLAVVVIGCVVLTDNAAWWGGSSEDNAPLLLFSLWRISWMGEGSPKGLGKGKIPWVGW